MWERVFFTIVAESPDRQTLTQFTVTFKPLSSLLRLCVARGPPRQAQNVTYIYTYIQTISEMQCGIICLTLRRLAITHNIDITHVLHQILYIAYFSHILFHLDIIKSTENENEMHLKSARL